MQRGPLEERPAFWRQGLLILLPAILLAGVGLYALRRDRLLVEHDATEQARQIASVLAQRDIPSALAIQIPGGNRIHPVTPEDDPVAALSGNEVVGFLTDATLGLLWPPPIIESSLKQPVDISGLDGIQVEAWQSFQSSIWSGPSPARLRSSESELQRLIALDLPENCLALARYQTAVRLLQQGEWNPARDLFELIRSRHAGINGESGLSLKTLSEWHLLRAFDFNSERAPNSLDWLDGFMSGLMKQPSMVSGRLLADAMASMEQKRYPDEGIRARWLQAIQNWRRVLRAHENSRALHEALLTPGSLQGNRAAFVFTNFWFSWHEESWLITRRLENDRTWFLARPIKAVSHKVNLAVERRAVPGCFGVEVRVADHRMTPELDSTPEAAAPEETISAISKADVSVRIHLTDAKGFYARQQGRTLLFGGLILTSLAAVITGLLTTWRAFGQQHRLNILKTNFVSSVSHELRTPIASVRMMAEELCDSPAPDPLKSRQYHGFMAQECRRLTGLIENVLDFARMEQGRKAYDFEPIDLSKLVETTVTTWTRYAAEKSVHLLSSIAPEPLEIEADGQALQQVLANLLDNAIKYSPIDGSVEVGLEPKVRDGEGLMGARIWVRDQGPGIPLEEQARIFDRFYRYGSELRRETQGVGLGLSIAHGIVLAHQGRIEVISTPSNGSRFIVDLPLKQTDRTQPDERRIAKAYGKES